MAGARISGLWSRNTSRSLPTRTFCRAPTRNLYCLVLAASTRALEIQAGWSSTLRDRPELNFYLLVATLKPVVNPSKEHWVIPVDVELLNAKTGDTVASWNVSTTISSPKDTARLHWPAHSCSKAPCRSMET